jgi:hypothetical protein
MKKEPIAFSEQTVNLYNNVSVKPQKILAAYFTSKYRIQYEKYAFFCVINNTENTTRTWFGVNKLVIWRKIPVLCVLSQLVIKSPPLLIPSVINYICPFVDKYRRNIHYLSNCRKIDLSLEPKKK